MNKETVPEQSGGDQQVNSEPYRVLVIAPHPDDEVLGCGGSIALHIRSGRTVDILFLTDGEGGNLTMESSALAQLRREEAGRAAAILGVQRESLHFAGLGDGLIDPANLDQVGLVASKVRTLRPNTIYLPHRDDASFDHEAAFKLSWRAIGLAGSSNFREWGERKHWTEVVLGYEVWGAISGPQYFEDIDDVVSQKRDALLEYRSQGPAAKGSTHVGEDGLLLSGWRGATTIGGHREAFRVYRVERLFDLG